MMSTTTLTDRGVSAANIRLYGAGGGGNGGDSELRKHALLNRMQQTPSVISKIASVQMETRTATTTVIAKSITATNPSSSLKPKNLHLGMFEIGRPLGKGKFGRVYLARHRESGLICALKMLKKEEISREKAEMHVRREIEVHSNLRHPGVLGFYGWFHDSQRIFLVLEYAAGGELYRSLQKAGHFSERTAAKYIAQVALALSYLHSKHVMHRDMKPENILIGLHGELKLADFGYSVHSPSNRRDTVCGTPDYLPPEMLQPKKTAYTKAVDQWTLGVLTYEFLTGEAPFEDSMPMTYRKILKRDMKPLPKSISPEARDFVDSLLNLNPAKRLPLEDVFRHPWIVQNSKLPGP